MELADLKAQWSQVLFALESRNRVAWLTFFDARLAKLEANTLHLDFSDPEKFSGDHSYVDSRTKFAPLLQDVIQEVASVRLEITW
jgi:hypothetical protein